jgi:hypothetical protein
MIIRLAACLAIGAGVAGLQASTAEGRVGSHRSGAQATSVSIQSAVCAILRYPVGQAAKKLIALIELDNIDVLATALVTRVATNLICRPVAAKLQSVLAAAVALQPAVGQRIGPFAFNLRAIGTPVSGLYNRFVLAWTEYDLTSRRRYHYAWYHFDNSLQWFRLPTNGLVPRVATGHTVQFAVRIDDYAGLVSPWTYSVSYHDQ